MPYKPESNGNNNKTYDLARKADHSFYNTTEWRTLRSVVLAQEPICKVCGKEFSTEVDHILPRVTYAHLALERSNCQGLCRSCHSKKTKRETAGRGRNIKVRVAE